MKCPGCNHEWSEHVDGICTVSIDELPSCRVCAKPLRELRAMPWHGSLGFSETGVISADIIDWIIHG